MSDRNEKRRKQGADLPPLTNMSSTSMDPAPTGTLLNFSCPTEIVDLPSKGKLYPQGSPLQGLESIEIRHMTAKGEDILTNQSLLRKGVAIDRMLESVILDSNIRVQDLLIGDKNALMYAARITGYGAAYEVVMQCTDCSKKFEHTFDLSRYSECYHTPEEQTEAYKFTSNGTIETTLPKTNFLVEMRVLDGKDEAKLAKAKAMKEKNNILDSSLTDLLKTMVIKVNGVTDRAEINGFIDIMPAMDSKHLRNVYKDATPNVIFKQEAECDHCGYTMESEVPITGDFFWPR